MYLFISRTIKAGNHEDIVTDIWDISPLSLFLVLPLSFLWWYPMSLCMYCRELIVSHGVLRAHFFFSSFFYFSFLFLSLCCRFFMLLLLLLYEDRR
jgi:hypothetical protein